MARRAEQYFARYVKSSFQKLGSDPLGTVLKDLNLSALADETAATARQLSRWAKKAVRAEQKDLERKEMAKARYWRRERGAQLALP